VLKRRISLLSLAAILLVLPWHAQAQQMSLIRDAEIENTIRIYATPLFQQAGVEPSAVKIHIVNTRDINAFVAGGLNLFLMTGLIVKTKNASELIGVIAHESGHIAGGHLLRGQEAYEHADYEAIAAALLGIAAGVASKNGQVAGAVMGAGNDIATRDYLSFSRSIEGSADTAALRFLDNLHESSVGFLDFMKTLMDQEALLSMNQDPYVRTHPLTQDRIDEIQHHVDTSPWTNATLPPQYDELHHRMVAKLYGFLYSPGETLHRYPPTDNSIAGRYARAIAYYRIPDLAQAMPLIDGLIAERPQDPYFHELKGEIFYENARVAEAIPEYKLAVKLLPDNSLIRTELGTAEIAGVDAGLAANDPSLLKDAAENLRFATHQEADNADAWLQLSTAYAHMEDQPHAEAALAEYSLLVGKWAEAIFHADRAAKGLPRGSPVELRMEDVRVAAEQGRDEEKRHNQ
jgi:predicted Zn-dependent protease